MTDKEKEFYSKPFKFSYSSLNKLLFSPSLFYRDYILGDKEEKLDKHLIEGKLIHCLVFEPQKLEEKFKIVPGKTPTDNVRKILHKLAESLLMTDKSDIDLMSEDLQEKIVPNIVRSVSSPLLKLGSSLFSAGNQKAHTLTS